MGILIRNNIVNQKGNPAWYEDTLAARPIANLQGRMFVDTDNPSTGIYRDTGSSWINVADPGAGTTGTLQQVTTNGSSTNVGISVSANGIGIGTAFPGANILDIHGTTGVLAQLENTTTQNSLLSFRNQGAGAWSVGNGYNAGANDFIIYDAVSFVNRVTLTKSGIFTLIGDINANNANFTGTIKLSNALTITNSNSPFATSSIIYAITGFDLVLGANGQWSSNYFSAKQDGSFLFSNAGSISALKISTTGNILINTSSDIGSTLNCNGNGYFSTNLQASKVGIGTSPSNNLDVFKSDATVYNPNAFNTPIARLRNTDTTSTNNTALFQLSTANFSSIWDFGLVETGTNYFGDFVFQNRTGAGTYAEALRITHLGQLLLGTTTAGNSKLTIVGLPTSSVGLTSGDVYSNLGILTIVP